MTKKLADDDNNGVSSVIELILTFVIASLIFSLIIMNVTPLLIDQPRYMVTRNQFEDVGNGVSTMLIDTYLIAPSNGALSTGFVIPSTVGGSTYNISVTDLGSTDRELRIHSLDSDVYVVLTLNGVHSTLPINGTVNSTDIVHRINYKPLPGG